MKKFLGYAGFQIIALALAGLSIFVFFAMISPYVKARALLTLVQAQVRATVAAERFLRYSTLETKEGIDYGLIQEGVYRKTDLERNTEDLERWRSEAHDALTELRSAMQAAQKAGNPQDFQDDLILASRAKDDHAKLGGIEQGIRAIADSSGSQVQMTAVIRQEFIPVVSSISLAATRMVQTA